jgi:flagellar operon protein
MDAMLERVSGQLSTASAAAQTSSVGTGQERFDAVLRQELDRQQGAVQEVAFSKHAQARVEQRGIEITDTLMDQLRLGLARAQEKGATNVLAMDEEKAFIINVPNAKVITALTQEELKENIFTNIDGAVFL